MPSQEDAYCGTAPDKSNGMAFSHPGNPEGVPVRPSHGHRNEDGNAIPIECESSASNFWLYGFQGAVSFSLDDQESYTSAVRRLLSKHAWGSVLYSLLEYDRRGRCAMKFTGTFRLESEMDTTRAGWEPLPWETLRDTFRAGLGEKEFFVMLNSDVPPQRWEPSFRELKTRIAKIKSADGSTCYVSFPPSEDSSVQDWDAVKYRPYFQTALNVLVGKGNLFDFQCVPGRLGFDSSESQTLIPGVAQPSLSFLRSLVSSNGISHKVPEPSKRNPWAVAEYETHDVWAQPSIVHTYLVLPNYYPSKEGSSRAVVSCDVYHLFDACRVANQAREMVRQSLDIGADEVLSIWLLSAECALRPKTMVWPHRERSMVQIPMRARMDTETFGRVTNLVKESLEYGWPVFVYPDFPYEPTSHGPWINAPADAIQLPPLGSPVTDLWELALRKCSNRDDTPPLAKTCVRIQPCEFRTKKMESLTYFVSPDMDDNAWFTIRVLITARLCSVSLVPFKEARERGLPPPCTWGPRYGAVARLRAEMFTGPFYSGSFEKSDEDLDFNLTTPTHGRHVLRTPGTVPQVSMAILTPTEQASLEKALVAQRNMNLGLNVHCPIKGCSSVLPVSMFCKHVDKRHRLGGCLWCDSSIFWLWSDEQKHRHIRENHRDKMLEILQMEDPAQGDAPKPAGSKKRRKKAGDDPYRYSSDEDSADELQPDVDDVTPWKRRRVKAGDKPYKYSSDDDSADELQPDVDDVTPRKRGRVEDPAFKPTLEDMASDDASEETRAPKNKDKANAPKKGKQISDTQGGKAIQALEKNNGKTMETQSIPTITPDKAPKKVTTKKGYVQQGAQASHTAPTYGRVSRAGAKAAAETAS